MGSNSPRKGHCQLWDEVKPIWTQVIGVGVLKPLEYQSKNLSLTHIPTSLWGVSKHPRQFTPRISRRERLRCPDRQFWFMKSQCVSFQWISISSERPDFSALPSLSSLAGWASWQQQSVVNAQFQDWLHSQDLKADGKLAPTLLGTIAHWLQMFFSRPRSLISPFYHTL